MTRPKTPKMQVRQAVTIRFDHLTHPLRHSLVGGHVKQDGTRVAHQRVVGTIVTIIWR
jgi:hypothetical protein